MDRESEIEAARQCARALASYGVRAAAVVLLLHPALAAADFIVPASAIGSINGGTLDLGCTDLIVAGTLQLGGGQVLNVRNVTIQGGGTIDGAPVSYRSAATGPPAGASPPGLARSISAISARWARPASAATRRSSARASCRRPRRLHLRGGLDTEDSLRARDLGHGAETDPVQECHARTGRVHRPRQQRRAADPARRRARRVATGIAPHTMRRCKARRAGRSTKNWPRARWEVCSVRAPASRGSSSERRTRRRCRRSPRLSRHPAVDGRALVANATLHAASIRSPTTSPTITGAATTARCTHARRDSLGIDAGERRWLSANVNISIGMPASRLREDPKLSRRPRGPCIFSSGQTTARRSTVPVRAADEPRAVGVRRGGTRPFSGRRARP